jgi:hypothetical protein
VSGIRYLNSSQLIWLKWRGLAIEHGAIPRPFGRERMLAMLVTLMAVLAVSVSEGFQWLSNSRSIDTGPPAAPLYKPEDPSTLTLAVIGVGTLVAYLATRRSSWGRRPVVLSEPETLSSHDNEVPGAQTTGPEEQPSRGAA